MLQCFGQNLSFVFAFKASALFSVLAALSWPIPNWNSWGFCWSTRPYSSAAYLDRITGATVEAEIPRATSQLLQLFQGDTKVLPSKLKDSIPPACLGSVHGPPPRTNPEQMLVLGSSNSTLNPSCMTELLTLSSFPLLVFVISISFSLLTACGHSLEFRSTALLFGSAFSSPRWPVECLQNC